MSNQYLQVDKTGPPQRVAGIRSMKCAECDFEFVYIFPEEAEDANLVIAQHLHEAHGGNLMTVTVMVTQH